MATARKRWFRVADAVARKHVSNDALAFFVRLSAHLNGRWARDGLSASEATRCTISEGELIHLAGTTGRKSVANAARIMREWCANWDGIATESEANRSRIFHIEWPNFADFQRLTPESGAQDARQLPPPRPASRVPRQKREEYETPAAAGRPKAAPKTPAPDRLMPEQMAALRAWCTEKAPAALDRFDELVAACLDFHRGKGNAMADWPATCRTWIRNDARFGAPRAGPGGVAARADERAQVMADNARAAVRLVEERERAERERRDRAAGRPADPHVRQLQAGGDPVAH